MSKEKLRFELIKPIPQTLCTGTGFPGRSRGCKSQVGEGACFMSRDGLQEGRKRADTEPEVLLFSSSTTTAGAIFCCYARTLFSYTSLCFLLNKQLVTTTHAYLERPGYGRLRFLILFSFPMPFSQFFFP